jgi:phosphoglycolate phosphatase-like HAD superfamily hydrolase
MNDTSSDWLLIPNPEVQGRLGNIHHALFDFDGTVSVMREGWEEVMLPVMIESIGGGQPLPASIVQEVRDYIDRSTGILTILQMEWLADAVRRHGFVTNPLTPYEYKAIYLRRLMVRVNERIGMVESGEVDPVDMMIKGAPEFVKGLWQAGVTLYLASGTDHQDVMHEASVLGMAPFFAGGVYGALDKSVINGKEKVIQQILDDHRLSGNELLVVGDGPVEIREAKLRGAITLGLASDEIVRSGWNQHKVTRLSNAGVDMLTGDFIHYQELLDIFCRPGMPS